MHRLNVYLVSIMCLVALAVSTARAGPLSPADAVLVLDSPATAAQAMAASGVPVRCAPGKSVGVWVGGQAPLTVQHMAVQGCAVGVMVTGEGHTVRHMRIQGIPQSRMLAAIIDYGSGGSITDNIMLEDSDVIYAEYGIVLGGHTTFVARNRIGNVAKDAILLTGHDYLVEANYIRGALRHGINVVASVPVNGPTGAILALPRLAAHGNVVRLNDIAFSRRIDLRQWPTVCFDHEGNPAPLANTYFHNLFSTKSHPCLD